MFDVAAAQQVLDDSPFGPWWGFRVEDVEPDRATVRLPARPELFRPGGVLQGGGAMTLADVTVWIAIMSTTSADDPAVTVGQTSAFLGAARSDLVCVGPRSSAPGVRWWSEPPTCRTTPAHRSPTTR